GIEATGTYRSKDPSTQVSTFFGELAFSSNGQVFAGVEHSFYPAGNRWNLQGEWGYADAALAVYGLGASTPKSRAACSTSRSLPFTRASGAGSAAGCSSGRGIAWTCSTAWRRNMRKQGRALPSGRMA